MVDKSSLLGTIPVFLFLTQNYVERFLNTVILAVFSRVHYIILEGSGMFLTHL